VRRQERPEGRPRQTAATAGHNKRTPVDEWLVERGADLALATGQIQCARLNGRPVAVVPDQYESVGPYSDDVLTKTMRLRRGDGRTVYVFQWPENVAVPR
jgi:hypothetical protein